MAKEDSIEQGSDFKIGLNTWVLVRYKNEGTVVYILENQIGERVHIARGVFNKLVGFKGYSKKGNVKLTSGAKKAVKDANPLGTFVDSLLAKKPGKA